MTYRFKGREKGLMINEADAHRLLINLVGYGFNAAIEDKSPNKSVEIADRPMRVAISRHKSSECKKIYLLGPEAENGLARALLCNFYIAKFSTRNVS
jgi:hypothetical protein